MLRALLAILPLAAFGQSPVLKSDPFSCFTMSGAPAADMQISTVDGTRVWRVKGAKTTNPWDVRIRCFDTLAVNRGDTIVATFRMRTLRAEGGLGATALVFEKGTAPYTKSVEYTTGASGEWRRVEIPFRMVESYPAGSLATQSTSYNVSFWLGYGVQELEIADLTLSNHGPDVPFETLGLTSWPYEGRAADAPWRKAAAERIEAIRKADLAVSVRDANGEPVAGAPVHVRMKRHAFPFGTAVDGGVLRTNETYREAVKQYFNAAVTENDLKWPFWETWARASAAFALDWFAENKIPVRGHTIIWPGRSNLPPDVAALLNSGNKEALRQRIDSHITEIATYARGRVVEWDVLNEPITNRDVQALLGDAEMATWFQKTRAIDPDARLYVNDYSLTEGGGYNLAKLEAFYQLVKNLIDAGAPVDGVGMQSHFSGSALTAPDRVLEIYDRYAQLGRDIAITEFDVDTTDENLQAQYLRDYLTVSFSHPAVRGFLMWGFWEGRHWRPNAAMIRRDWTAKPALEAWKKLIYSDWWTDVEGQTGEDGMFRVRAFLGDYEIDAAGRTVAVTVVPGGATAEFR